MPLELSSPVRSEGHGSSTDRGGRKQRNLPLMQRHRLVHPAPPSPKASSHTQDSQLTPHQSQTEAPAVGLGYPHQPLPASASSSAPSLTLPRGWASRASRKVSCCVTYCFPLETASYAPCKMSPACPSCHSPWRSSLLSFPGGLSWLIRLPIPCLHQ